MELYIIWQCNTCAHKLIECFKKIKGVRYPVHSWVSIPGRIIIGAMLLYLVIFQIAHNRLMHKSMMLHLSCTIQPVSTQQCNHDWNYHSVITVIPTQIFLMVFILVCLLTLFNTGDSYCIKKRIIPCRHNYT